MMTRTRVRMEETMSERRERVGAQLAGMIARNDVDGSFDDLDTASLEALRDALIDEGSGRLIYARKWPLMDRSVLEDAGNWIAERAPYHVTRAAQSMADALGLGKPEADDERG